MSSTRTRGMGLLALSFLVIAPLACDMTIGPRATETPPPPPPPAATDTPPPAETPVPTVPSTATATPTPEMITGMALYSNLAMGVSLYYPEDWVYEAIEGQVTFAESEEALDAGPGEEGPALFIFVGTPEQIEDEIGPAATPQDLLDTILEQLRGEDEEAEIGETEEWAFGETPGLGVEVSWFDSGSELRIRGYLFVATSDEVAGVGLGATVDEEWAAVAPIVRQILRSLELFAPELLEPVDRGSISPGETVQGTLAIGGVDRWSFEGQAGEYVTLHLDAVDPDELDTYLELYDEDEVLMAEDDDTGEGYNAAILGLELEATGTYYIQASAYSGEGDYTLSLETSAEGPSGGGEIKYGQMVRGTLAEGAGHEWTFYGEEGDVIVISMEGEMDNRLSLYGPDGERLTDDDDSGEGPNALIEYYILPADGSYTIGAGAYAAGAYALTLDSVIVEIPTLSYGSRVEGTLEEGRQAHYLFEGDAGDVVTISMNGATEDFDTYLELFAPNGVRVATDDDSGGNYQAQIAGFELRLSGTYHLIARGYGEGDFGDYALILAGP